MQTDTIKVSQIRINGENPRTITTDKFNKLVESILTFPKMLELRPIVIDKTYKALGGNMRTQALNFIAKMSLEDITARLTRVKDYNKMAEAQKKALLGGWEKWLKNPTVTIVRADSLTEDEKKQFIIKDNVSFGAWDFDALANKFDSNTLGSWGMDVWQMPAPEPMTAAPTPAACAPTSPSVPAESEDDGTGIIPQAQTFNLPPEIAGADLTPADLPDIQGSDETLMERIIIVYPKERAAEVAALIGKEKIEKIIYRFDEINGDLSAE